jgi:hypothetical protein
LRTAGAVLRRSANQSNSDMEAGSVRAWVVADH